MAPTELARITEIGSKCADSKEEMWIQFRNERKPLPVITISLDSVLLNPRSHRIRAQIESHSKRELIETDPHGDEAQQIVEEILRETAGFNALLDNLKERGQLEPGIVTHIGVLVNANTRAVALRQLRVPYIRVGVLPASANENEITELEAHLQLSRDFKQEYSLTNELLFIQEQYSQGMTREDLAILLGKAQSRNRAHLKNGVEEIDRSLRILQHIREVQAESGGHPPLTFFDAHESALTEADRAYFQALSRNPDEATRIRDGRMLGIITGVTYRNLRNWDSDEFFQNYVDPQFNSDELSTELRRAVLPVEIEGASSELDDGLSILDEVTTTHEEVGVVNLRALLTAVATTYEDSDDTEIRPGLSKADFVGAINDRITQAAEEKAADLRDERRATTPFNLIREARKKVAKAAETLDSAQSEREFERGKLKQELRRLKRELDSVIRKFDRGD